MTIKDNGGREKLSEGRDFGMGFGFLKKVKDDEYETAIPITACKDYLNDQVYTEITGKSIGVYGLTTTKQKLFDDGVFIGLKIVNYNNGGEYKDQPSDTKRLSKTYSKAQELVNFVENQFKLKEFTTITPANDGMYLVSTPKFWVQYPYLISLYTLLLRLGQFYEKAVTPDVFLEKYDNPLDSSLWKQCITNYKALVSKGLVKIDLDKFDPKTEAYTIHNGGIRALQING